MNYTPGKDVWKKIEKKNPVIVLSVLYAKKMYIYLAEFSKQNSNHEKKTPLF